MQDDDSRLNEAVTRRSGAFTSFREAVGAESADAGAIGNNLTALRVVHGTVVDSSKLLLVGAQGILRSKQLVSDYTERARVGREATIGTLMFDMSEVVGGYTENVMTSLQAIVAASAITALVRAHKQWLQKGNFDGFRAIVRESETPFIVAAPVLSERLVEQVDDMVDAARKQRLDIHSLMAKNGNYQQTLTN